MKSFLRIYAAAASVLLLTALQSWASEVTVTNKVECGIEEACLLGSRSYHVRAPDGWDGKTPLPVLLHFHGWGRQGKLIMNHSRIAGATRNMGVLLVAPNGEGRTWNMWQPQSPDIEFTNRVVSDVEKRFPIDKSRLFVSGYSYGSIMAWRYACAEGTRINTVLAISGAFRDQDVRCSAPVNLRHVHGTNDGVVGYPYGRDGTVESAVSFWRTLNQCADEKTAEYPWQAVEILPFTRHEWKNCASGKSVVLDVHERGHFIPRFWIEHHLKELLNSAS